MGRKGMGVVDDEVLNRELSINGIKEKESDKIESHPPSEKGRGTGTLNVPEGLRKLIAQEHIENGRESALALADKFGISSSSVSAYAKGARSTNEYKEGNKELRTHTNAVKERIAGKARRRLIQSLNHMTEDKLQETGVKDLSSIAKDMSVIIKNMEPDPIKDVDNSTKVQVVIMAPPQRREEEYETITVND